MSRSCGSKRYIFQRDNCIPANDARQAAQPFARYWVALMRHCRTAFLPFPEKFFQFENFRALKMPKLSRPTVDARSDQSERSTKFRVPVSLHDLGGKRRRF